MSHPLDREAATVLRRARARISEPGAQTQWAFARDAAGNAVAATSPRAVSWCVAGALVRDAQPGPSPLERAAGRSLPRALADEERRPRERHAQSVLLRALALLDEAAPGPAPRLSPSAWLNNTAGHEDTLRMLDRAIQRAEASAPKSPTG